MIMSRPNKKGFPIGPPTIGLETIPALNANINKNLKLIFLVRQTDFCVKIKFSMLELNCLDTCLEFPDLLKRSPQCLDAIGPDFEPTLFQCQDNKEILCKMKLCEKHQFIVKC